jgi:hypothetical protein
VSADTNKEQLIEHALTLWAARRPRVPEAELMLKAAETIYQLRAALKYEQDRAAVRD